MKLQCKDCQFWIRLEGRDYGECTVNPRQLVVMGGEILNGEITNQQIKAVYPFHQESDPECSLFLLQQ